MKTVKYINLKYICSTLSLIVALYITSTSLFAQENLGTNVDIIQGNRSGPDLIPNEEFVYIEPDQDTEFTAPNINLQPLPPRAIMDMPPPDPKRETLADNPPYKLGPLPDDLDKAAQSSLESRTESVDTGVSPDYEPVEWMPPALEKIDEKDSKEKTDDLPTNISADDPPGNITEQKPEDIHIPPKLEESEYVIEKTEPRYPPLDKPNMNFAKEPGPMPPSDIDMEEVKTPGEFPPSDVDIEEAKKPGELPPSDVDTEKAKSPGELPPSDVDTEEAKSPGDLPPNEAEDVESALPSDALIVTELPEPQEEKIQLINTLSSDRYVQILSSKNYEAVLAVVKQDLFAEVRRKDELRIYKQDSSEYYRLIIGPFRHEDVGVELLRWRKNGYADAFIVYRK